MKKYSFLLESFNNVKRFGNDTVYLVKCHDSDKTLLKLLQDIKRTADPGHTFDVVVDPGCKNPSKYCIDGDGSDKIKSIVTFEDDDNMINLLLNNIDTIRRICRDTYDDNDDPKEKFDIEGAKKSLRDIRCTCDALLDGVEIPKNPQDAIVNTILYWCDKYLNNDIGDMSANDVINHIKKYCLKNKEIRKEYFKKLKK